jgi:beta-xylosidase
VELADGDSWFIHFQDHGAYGRILHLQPMRWQEGWPVMGTDFNGNGIGEPVQASAAPALPSFSAAIPAADEFDSQRLGLQWQWQANIDTAWYGLQAARGFLRLYTANSSPENKNLWNQPNIVAQKFPAERFEAVIRLSFHSIVPGDRAGLVIFGGDYATLTLTRERESYLLEQTVCREAEKGTEEEIIAAAAIDETDYYLKVTVGAEARCFFSYSKDGNCYLPIGAEFIAKPGKWVGAKIGLYATGISATGYADFDFIRFTIL